MTAELQKGKYIYYRCTGYRGKCCTPYFREEEISQRMGQLLKNIHVPDEVVGRIADSFDHEQERFQAESDSRREKLHQRLSAVRRHMEYSNQAPSYYMWQHLEPEVDTVRKRLAAMFGCDMPPEFFVEGVSMTAILPRRGTRIILNAIHFVRVHPIIKRGSDDGECRWRVEHRR